MQGRLGAVTTLVFCHAHPDDEALLTAGTMARATAEGHRVVLVMATDGAAGLTSAELRDGLADRRRDELAASARALGIARTVHLGHADSGLDGRRPGGMAGIPADDVAGAIAAVLDEEGADVVVGYDPSGGYGHPDHLRVHAAVRLARGRARRPPRLFEATLPREPIASAVRIAATLRITPSDFDPAEFARAWTPRRLITHRVDVRDHLDAKRASLAAHASQAQADGATRTLGILTRLPAPVFTALLGTEYYVDVTSAAAASTSPGPIQVTRSS